MQIDFLTTAEDALLEGLREVLHEAETAQLCVAFVSMEGVQLLRPELQSLGDRARLLVTTVFGSTSPAALDQAASWGVHVATLNPGGSSTYHPKLYVGSTRGRLDAVVGSANMTSGLLGNVEVATRLRGTSRDRALHDAWQSAESLWSHPLARPWKVGTRKDAPESRFDPDLWQMLEQRFGAVAVRDRVVETLGPQRKTNRIARLLRTGLKVETDRSKARGVGPEVVPAWMFNVAWTYLRAHGRLTNRRLLNVLHVHRSTAVLAVLAELPGVRVASRRPITLAWRTP